MASVNDAIVREYFEMLGFMVRQPRKYQVAARSRKEAREQVDLIVVNPGGATAGEAASLLWTGQDLQHVSQAVVGVRGWHTDRFSPAVLKLAPEVCRFAAADVVEGLASELSDGPVSRILCLSELPASKELQSETLEVLKEHGIDGVLLFPVMLLELLRGVDTNKNYEKSNLLQLLRILKTYDLVKDSQLELFKGRR